LNSEHINPMCRDLSPARSEHTAYMFDISPRQCYHRTDNGDNATKLPAHFISQCLC